MTIGELSQETGASPKAIRHYESLGLLPSAQRQANGYRSFSRLAVQRLKVIARFREFGFPLKEIKLILERPQESLEALLECQRARLSSEIAKMEASLHQLELWSTRLRNPPLEESEYLEIMEAIVNLEQHFEEDRIAEMKRLHEGIEPEQQERAKAELAGIVGRADASQLRELMTRFMGPVATAIALASKPALRAILALHGVKAEEDKLSELVSKD